MKSGRRAWRFRICPAVDSAFLIAGMLAAAAYFQAADGGKEDEIRRLGDALYRQAGLAMDAERGGGGEPRLDARERAFCVTGWNGYDEAVDRLHPRAGIGGRPTRCLTRPITPGLLPIGGKDLRHRVPLCRTDVHSSVVAYVD